MLDQALRTTTLTAAAERVAEVAREHADEADRERRLAPDVVDALLGAGFARHCVPGRFGGAGSSFGDLLGALVTVGQACASASWCGLTLASSGRIAAFLPPDGQREIWDGGPDTPIASALPPSGTATPVTGGWELTGRWAFLSGVDFCDWVILCVPAGDDGPLFAAVPRRELQVEDTWFTLGMRGTGSRTAVVERAFVPAHRTCAQRDVIEGRNAYATEPTYRIPVRAAMPPLFAAPGLGAALGMVTDWAGVMGRKKRDGRPAPQHPLVRRDLALSTGELRAARLLLERAAEQAGTGSVTHAEAVRTARDASTAAELTRKAVDRLFEAGGTSIQDEGNPLQRAWRDVHSSMSHALLRFEMSDADLAALYWPSD